MNSTSCAKRGEIAQMARREVIEYAHAVAPPHQRFGDVRSDEARSARHEKSSHSVSPFHLVRCLLHWSAKRLGRAARRLRQAAIA